MGLSPSRVQAEAGLAVVDYFQGLALLLRAKRGATLVPLSNLYHDFPDSLPEEQFDELERGDGFKLQRIISTGHATPEGEWYDQDQDEWVVLLAGSAGLRFEDEPQEIVMRPGDYLQIPAHRRHRVEWTDLAKPTVWLALHHRPPQP